jgi:sec-independent protein translocase protein TatC
MGHPSLTMIKIQEKLRLFLATDFLTRLRRLLIFYSALFLVLWLAIFLLFPKIFPFFMHSYYHLVAGKPLVFISIEEALFVAIKASFYLALILLLPIFLIKLWGLISPELYEYERRFLRRLIALSFLLSVLGFLFGYYFLFPALVKVFLYFGENFENNLRIGAFLFFMLKTILFSVLIFQIPIIFALLVKEGWITEDLYRKRKLYLLSIFFGLSFIIAPSDFFSQLLLTLFFFLFFKLSFLIAKVL